MSQKSLTCLSLLGVAVCLGFRGLSRYHILFYWGDDWWQVSFHSGGIEYRERELWLGRSTGWHAVETEYILERQEILI